MKYMKLLSAFSICTLLLAGCTLPDKVVDPVTYPAPLIELPPSMKAPAPDDGYTSKLEALVKEKGADGANIVFFSADYCGACKQYKPVMTEYQTVGSLPSRIVELDTSNKDNPTNIEFNELMAKHDLHSTPTTLLLDKDGNLIDKFEGARDLTAINNLVDTSVNSFAKLKADPNKDNVIVIGLQGSSNELDLGVEYQNLLNNAGKTLNFVKLDGNTRNGRIIADIFNADTVPIIIRLDKDLRLVSILQGATKEDLDSIKGLLK